MSRSTQTNSAPAHLICPLTGQVLVDPVQIIVPVMGPNGYPAFQSYHFERAAIEQILTTTRILPIFNVQIAPEHIGTPAFELVRDLQQFRAAQLGAPQPSMQATAPQLVPVYHPNGSPQPSSVTTSIAPLVTATVKNPPKKEEGFLATLRGLFSSDKSTQTVTATTRAPSQQATATTSPLATTRSATTRSDAKERILLSVSDENSLKISFPTVAMREKFAGLLGYKYADSVSIKLPAEQVDKNKEGLPTLCTTARSPERIQLLIQSLELRENDMIKFGTGEQSSQLFLSHPRFFSDPNAFLKIRIPKWLQPEASLASQPSGPRR